MTGCRVFLRLEGSGDSRARGYTEFRVEGLGLSGNVTGIWCVRVEDHLRSKLFCRGAAVNMLGFWSFLVLE